MQKLSVAALFLSAVVVSVWAFADISQDVGFTKKEKQNMIDLHNHYRARVARGEERNQPQAADMLAMEWDDRLVRSAQKWSSTCRGWHNKNEERRFSPYPFTGQNYAGLMGMTESMRGWYDEVTEGNFQFQGLRCSGVCGHYTQVVWGKAHLVGCAQNKCKAYGKDKSNVYCEYAPGGNTVFKMKKDPVYTVGPPCSKCPAGFGFCMSESLCASKRACSNTDSKCRCTISSCQNGGTFDAANCQCKCKPAFEGLRCELPCKDNIDYCESYKQECAWDAMMWMWMSKDCRKFCKKCGAVSDPGKSNSEGIKTNAKDMSAEINCNNGANDASCDLWMDQCASQSDFIKKNCARACGFCKSEFIKASVAVKPPTAKPKGDCTNSHSSRDCDGWAESGECDRNSGWMHENCALSCGCPGQGQDDNLKCKNKYSTNSCDQWAKKGECERNPAWMKDNCARSCKCQ